MRRSSLLWIFPLVVAACAPSARADADGDGLSDEQEERFGTDPQLPDSDQDGIPDGADPSPLGRVRLLLTAGPIRKGGDGKLCVRFVATLRDGDGKLMPGQEVELTWAPKGGGLPATALVVKSNGDGAYEAELCANDRQAVKVTAVYEPPELSHWAQDEVVVWFGSDLPQPGVNTGTYRGAGPADGMLTVIALDATTVGYPDASPQQFAGAAVMVKTPGGRWFQAVTDESGIVTFTAPEIVGPLDVHVGAEGYRFTSYVGIDARAVAVPMARLDPVAGDTEKRTGTIEGVVTGFLGEYEDSGVPRFPKGNLIDSFFSGNPDAPAPIAIVQVAVKNRPLSSVSMGTILVEPRQGDPLPIPANMAICALGSDAATGCAEPADFQLKNLPEGQHLLFALGGLARNALGAVLDPYKLNFEPRALGIVRVSVRGGEVTQAEIPMKIDLRPLPGTTVDVLLDHPPDDWKTGKVLENVLAMPVMDTSGEGFIFVSVDGRYNRPGFDPSQPLAIRYPGDDHPVLRDLEIPGLNRLMVGLAGRASLWGADPPGISTPVRPQRKVGDVVGFNTPETWLDVPQFVTPRPPRDVALPLDTVSEDPFTGTIEWLPSTHAKGPQMYVLRVNYMTPAPRNSLIPSPAPGISGALGGPVSHCVWEIFLPGDRTRFDLPAFPDDAPARPLLRNPAPSMVDPIDPETEEVTPLPQHYDEKTIELELSAYILEAGGKTFRYDDDFAYDDVNLQCTVVSQDSFVVRVP